MSCNNRKQATRARQRLALAIAAAMALPAAAQQIDDTATTAEASKGLHTLDEVVVTAQKRPERLQDTPVAVTVLSEKALENANVSDIADLNQLVPALQLKGTFNGRVPIAMRGISTNANEGTIGLTSGVLVMVDGVPVSSDAMGANELQDLQSVEVLKGPQATLGGRAASAGVINLVTRKPSFDWIGSVGTMATNDGEYKASAFLSGPLSQGAAFSLSAYKNHREYPIHNIATGKDSKTDSQGVRGKLLLTPTDNLDITVAARGVSTDSVGGNFTYQYVDPGAGLFSYINGGVPYSEALAGLNVRYGNTDYNSPVTAHSYTRGQDFSVNVDYRLGDYTLSSTTAYQSERQDILQDVSVSAVYFFNVLTGGFAPAFYNQQAIILKPQSRSQEFKIVSPADRPVSFVAGVFYSNVEVWANSLRELVANPVDRTVYSDNRTIDGYGRITWKLGDDYDLLTGLRYNHDTVGYRITDRANGYASHGTYTENTAVGDVSLRKHFSRDAMAYATVARGYKPAAYNTAATLTSDEAMTPVDSERIQHYELGLKLSLLDHALTLNTALFQTTYNDYQVQIYEVEEGSVLADLQLANAGAARTRGLEMDANYAISTAARANASLAWTDAEFVSYKGAPCYPGQTEAQGCTTANGVSTQDLSGKSMPDAPRLKANLGAEYTWFGDQRRPFDLILGGQYAWRSGARMQADNNPKTYQPAFGIFNLSLTGSWSDGRFTASLFVNNVFDKFYLVNSEDFFGSLWGASTNAVIGQPARDSHRYTGVRLNWNFD
jgi:iron complex outermembrane receptor protein